MQSQNPSYKPILQVGWQQTPVLRVLGKLRQEIQAQSLGDLELDPTPGEGKKPTPADCPLAYTWTHTHAFWKFKDQYMYPPCTFWPSCSLDFFLNWHFFHALFLRGCYVLFASLPSPRPSSSSAPHFQQSRAMSAGGYQAFGRGIVFPGQLLGNKGDVEQIRLLREGLSINSVSR